MKKIVILPRVRSPPTMGISFVYSVLVMNASRQVRMYHSHDAAGNIYSVDFDKGFSGNALPARSTIDDELSTLVGVTITSSPIAGRAMILDSANPTGDDSDHATSTRANILIYS